MRSLEEIQAEQDIVLAKYPVLAALDSTSDVSFFALMRKMWSLLVQMLGAEWDQFKSEIEVKISSTRVGSLSWYVDQAKAFQYGDMISVIEGQVAYDVIDPAKKIVTQAAMTEDMATGRLTLKAAKIGSDGLVPLLSDELQALTSYIGKVKYAGVTCDVISIEADHLKIVATVKVDRQVIGNTGTLLSDSSKLPVLDAISAYIAALPYDSILSNTGLTDAIQAIKGVKDFTVSSSATRRPVSADWVPYLREVVSQAGHLKLHADSAITYIY